MRAWVFLCVTGSQEVTGKPPLGVSARMSYVLTVPCK